MYGHIDITFQNAELLNVDISGDNNFYTRVFKGIMIIGEILEKYGLDNETYVARQNLWQN